MTSKSLALPPSLHRRRSRPLLLCHAQMTRQDARGCGVGLTASVHTGAGQCTFARKRQVCAHHYPLLPLGRLRQCPSLPSLHTSPSRSAWHRLFESGWEAGENDCGAFGLEWVWGVAWAFGSGNDCGNDCGVVALCVWFTSHGQMVTSQDLDGHVTGSGWSRRRVGWAGVEQRWAVCGSCSQN